MKKVILNFEGEQHELTTDEAPEQGASELNGLLVDEDDCWYCDDCGKPMAENDNGYTRHQIGFCSEACADNYDYKR